MVNRILAHNIASSKVVDSWHLWLSPFILKAEEVPICWDRFRWRFEESKSKAVSVTNKGGASTSSVRRIHGDQYAYITDEMKEAADDHDTRDQNEETKL
ncbi:hypothetical protein ACS0TY_024266 [Phlomoides rotata]